MWNRRHNSFLLIKIRHQAFPFVFPVPLFILEDLLQAVMDVFTFGEFFLQRKTKPRLVLDQILSFLKEFRSLGSWDLVEVTHGKHHISISLY